MTSPPRTASRSSPPHEGEGGAQTTPSRTFRRLAQRALATRSRNAATLQLMEMRLNPDTLIAPHSHDDDEIFYVAEGSLHWDGHALEAGGSIFIAAGTVYSFRTGPQGARLLNFRARADHSFRPSARDLSTPANA